MTYSYVEQKDPFAVEFGFLSQEEILKSSVASVRNERIYDGGNAPTFEGVNDPRMGTMDKDRLCLTCKGTQVDCPGHFGHIELTRPVFHVGLLEYVRKLLKLVCFNCGRLLYPRDKDQLEQLRKVRNPKHRFFQVNRVSERHTTRECDS